MDPTPTDPLVAARMRKARAAQTLDPDEWQEAVRLYAIERCCVVLTEIMTDCPPLRPDEYKRVTSLIPRARRRRRDRLAVSA